MGLATDYDTFLYAPVLDMAYLEFLPLDEKEQPIPGKILSVSELTDGAKYETVLTSLSGLYRYRMADIVKVSGRKGRLPLFEILGRNKVLLDVMGEKCTFHQADDAIALLGEKIGEKEHPIYAYCEYALNGALRAILDLRCGRGAILVAGAGFLILLRRWPRASGYAHGSKPCGNFCEGANSPLTKAVLGIFAGSPPSLAAGGGRNGA